MSYLQAYGHPPVLSNAPADNNICAWPEAGDCEALHSHRPSNYSRISTSASRETFLSHRPTAHRCIGATGNRCLKRRVTANRKERRRTLSINNAFQELRGCIPQLPADTKLSKIKTLRLASSYIAHLMDLLASADEAKSPNSFKPQVVTKNEEPTSTDIMESSKRRKTSGRTGWPEYVWASELKRKNPS